MITSTVSFERSWSGVRLGVLRRLARFCLLLERELVM
jgi:hypothetical protein